MTEKRSDEVIMEETMKLIIQAVTGAIKEVTGEDLGIMIMVFGKDNDAGESICNYISNSDRGDVSKAMEQLLIKWKKEGVEG